MNNGDMPVNAIFDEDGRVSDSKYSSLSGDGLGLTKREYLAGLAMQAFITNYGITTDCQTTASRALNYADALLAELDKPKGE